MRPAKLKELQELFRKEGAKHQVLPLDPSVATRLVAPRPNLTADRTVFNYSGEEVTGIPHGAAPFLLNASYTMTAEVEIPPGGAEGMLNTNGGRFVGYGFYLLKGKPLFLWNLQAGALGCPSRGCRAFWGGIYYASCAEPKGNATSASRLDCPEIG